MAPFLRSFVCCSLLALTMTMACLSSSRSADAVSESKHKMTIHQLRIYEIFEHNKAAFHARFRDHAAQIMRNHGFDIIAMWEARSEKRTEFVYVLRWPDEATMKTCWERFMADPEWARIKKETAALHGRMVGEISDRSLRAIDYSPAL